MMAGSDFDAIVIGARCAGSPTAMLLARQGCRVLLLDRATFPSDTLSTHLLHPPGVDALRRWGLLGEVIATGCPAIDTYRFDFGAFILSGSPGTADSPVAFAPRRTVLDNILVSAAGRAGVEVRLGFNVAEIMVERGRVVGVRGRHNGRQVTERAAVVVGADGLRSTSQPRSGPRPTGRGRDSWPATTATGPDSRCTGASRPTCEPRGPLPLGRPTTTSPW